MKSKIVIRAALCALPAVLVATSTIGGYYFRHCRSESPTAKELQEYFVSTNPVYTERYQGSLADIAMSLNFFDFGSLLRDYYPQAVPVCTPIEAADGSTTYFYSFQTSHWQVDMSTLMDNETCLITSWIDLYSLGDLDTCYEYQSPPVKMKPSNYVANLDGGDKNGATNLFFLEREAFAHFLVLVKTGGLDQEYAVPFDLAGTPYQKMQPITPPDPAS